MRRSVPFLATVLLAGAIENVAGQEIEIVASADTVVLKVTIEPQDFDYAQAKLNLDEDVARKERDAKVAAVDALVNEMVKKSFDGGKVSDEDNKKAVQLRREWAQSVDSILQALPEASTVTFSVEFPDSPETSELKKHGDWPTVKKKLVGAEHDTMMLRLLQYRRRLTDALLSVAWLRMRQDPPRATDTRMDFWETEPVGSVTRTSDLDVTTVGYNCAGAVKYFNDFYRRGFCAESGVVLDSNVYCEIYKVHDWVPPGIEAVRDSNDDNPACQDAMALAKLRRYASEAEWNKFAKSTSHVPTVAEANSFFRYYEQQLQQAPTISSGAQCTAERGITLTGNAVTENAQMAAANELYAKRLERLRESLWANAIADQLKFEQSAANLFANESYNSQGPLLHVLGIVQGKRLDLIDIISKEQLLNSVNEQIGDALKDLNHYEKSGADIGEALYKSSKYIYRALEAVSLMRAKDKNIQWGPECQLQRDCRVDQRSLTEVETLFGMPGYDVETLLSIRAGEYGSEDVIRGGALEGITIKREYRTTDARAQGARFHATEIRDYQTLRDRLITSAIDINLRARPPAGPQEPQGCEFDVR